MSVPVTRSLESVLRTALAPVNQLRVLVGTYSATPTGDARYINVELNDATVKVPSLNGAPAGAAGAPVYVLADASRMWVLGTVTSTGPTPTGPVFIAKPGPPSSADGTNGSVYLDTTSLRLWGPKAAGAWPAAAVGRVLPLNPSYAQLTAG